MWKFQEHGLQVVSGGTAEDPVTDSPVLSLHDPTPLEPAWDGETVLTYLSHHVRTGAMVTLGFVELLEHTLSTDELDRPRFEDNRRGGPRTLRDVLGRIACSQEKMVRAVERVEKTNVRLIANL